MTKPKRNEHNWEFLHEHTERVDNSFDSGGTVECGAPDILVKSMSYVEGKQSLISIDPVATTGSKLHLAEGLTRLIACLGFSQGLFAVTGTPGRFPSSLCFVLNGTGALSNLAQGRGEGPRSTLSIARFISYCNSH